jgi:hypothetical protein
MKHLNLLFILLLLVIAGYKRAVLAQDTNQPSNKSFVL